MDAPFARESRLELIHVNRMMRIDAFPPDHLMEPARHEDDAPPALPHLDRRGAARAGAGGPCERHVLRDRNPVRADRRRHDRLQHRGHGSALLLVHGLFGDKEQWSGLACLLAGSGFAALAVDLPGYA
jgi:pimeloyl-ACP methyl ester carboxylesterase